MPSSRSPASTAVIPSVMPTTVTTARQIYMILLIRLYFLPPRFWLVKLRLVWYTAFMAVYTNPSMLAEAVLPAMAMDPKELTEDWISTLDMEKMAPCMPAGSPIFTIRFSFFGWIRSSLRFSFSAPGASIRLFSTRRADTCSEMTVAHPTPSTPIPSPMTKNRFSATLTTPAMNRKYRGRLVSPIALSMAAPKL